MTARVCQKARSSRQFYGCVKLQAVSNSNELFGHCCGALMVSDEAAEGVTRTQNCNLCMIKHSSAAWDENTNDA